MLERNSALKAFAIVIVIILGLFGMFFKNKAFMGKNQSALQQADQASEASALAPQQNQAQSPATGDGQPPQDPNTAAAAPAAPAPAQPGSEAQPAAENTPGEPEKGTVGAKLKQIREDSDARRKALEESAGQ